MRVQNPDQYAETLLSIALPKENYSAEKIRSMYGNSEIDLRFPTPIPVHIVYHTAFVDDAGHLQTRKDVYGRDARLLEVLRTATAEHGSRRHPCPAELRPPAGPSCRRTSPVNDEQRGGGRGFFETLFGGPADAPAPVGRAAAQRSSSGG